jgi:hypothetical protein
VRKTWGSRWFRRVEVVRLSGGWQLFPELYESLAAALRQEIALDWSNAMTLVRLGRRYIRNAIRNLPLIPCAHSIKDLDFAGSPVLVLGAGPSLDQTLDKIGRIFGTRLSDPDTRPFRIICVDTCLQALREREIKPDLAVALECQHWNLRDFIGLGSWEIPVAMDLSALPATRHVLGSRIFLFATRWTRLRFLDRLEDAGLLPASFPPLGSVGLSATAIARRVSSGPIFMAGLDFSFTLDQYHARSTPGHAERLRTQTRFRGILNAQAAFRPGVVSTLSKSGLPVRTDPAMQGYCSLFGQEFATEGRMEGRMRALVSTTGLGLGLRTVSVEEAAPVLGTGRDLRIRIAPLAECGVAALGSFMCRERNLLLSLRSMLRGDAPASDMGALLDQCDYLWAHFPDCAGADGRRPPATDLSFLKRVGVELSAMLPLFSDFV